MTEQTEEKVRNRQVLYRKWRSQDFNQIVGQAHVVRTLKNALVSGRIASSYLFCGPRGTGKTSMARIMAKSINCPNQKDANPCNQCSICRGITEGSFMDVIEMDAASHTQVDKIREFIVEKVNFRPVEGKRKIYIIDEVHKLSSFSFDALLKTIEEPPPFVTFILATTEPDKLPATILSRCQRYDFKRIAVSQISERLMEIAKAEGLTIEDGAVNLIAQSADGALRDALVILEQSASFSDEIITVGDVVSMLGITRIELLFSFADLVLERDTRRGLEFIDEMYREGRDLQRLAVDLLEHFRRLLLVKMVRDAETILEVTGETYRLLDEQAQRFKSPHLLHIISELMELRKNLKEAGMERILWESSVVKLTRWEFGPTIDALTKRIAALESQLAGGSPPPAKKSPEGPAIFKPPVFTAKPASENPADKKITKTSPPAIFSPPPPVAESAHKDKTPPGEITGEEELYTGEIDEADERACAANPQKSPATVDDAALWHNMLRAIKKENFSLLPVLQEVGAGCLDGNHYFMNVDSKLAFNRNLIEKNRSYLEELAGRLTGRKITLKIESRKGGVLFEKEEKPHGRFVEEVMDMFGASPVDRPL